MEQSLTKSIDDAFCLPGVSGVMCLDSNGLILASKGNVMKNSSGSLAALTKQASLLSQNITARNPVICLESDSGTVLVKKTNNITTAIFKDS